jgi:predicted ATPase/signal transduction histidine kinase
MELSAYTFEALRRDAEFILYRGHHRRQTDASPPSILAMTPILERPALASLTRMEHEYSLKGELDPEWAVRPLALASHEGRTMLVLTDPGGEPLDRLIGNPMELPQFLRAAVGLSAALIHMHRLGLVHKDLKPANILVNRASGEAWLTGFGIASRLPRERQTPAPPESIEGTLAYMAPEQTGRMNRSIDSRSDLYSLGVTLYQMLTGSLPFTASDPMEWVHCHIARRPEPPSERSGKIPVPVSHIIMKLLAKTAEERYQTAAGVESDLRRCLAEWGLHERIDSFALGEHDTPDRLLIPEKLHGRAREVEALLGAFDRIAKGGRPELVLVSGDAGIGKSAVVNELHKALLLPSSGLFASGKFDQDKRDIPYRAIAQSFQGLIRGLMSKSDAEMEGWRIAVSEALGAHGRLVVELVPELKLIVGEQPPTPDLPPPQTRRLFQIALRRFVGVFAKPEHPLVLFLDDLHWVDAATLDLIEDLMIDSDLRHLLVIGAYRENEIDPTHPLVQKLEAIRGAGATVGRITLTPLGREHLEAFVADALRCAPTRAAPLAQLVHRKTGGNPFFAIRFLPALADEGLIEFDATAGAWSWDLARISAKGYTENVVDLMVDKLSQLSAETQAALQQLACLGNATTTAMLSTVLATSEDQVHTALWDAARDDLVERLDGSYRFIHDRVQEAAYASIPDGQRAEAHLRIGRLLAARTPPEKRDEAIFDIVNQLNRGLGLITAVDEREQLAELNLTAGRRAHASTAYASALSYFVTGRDLLSEDCWERRRALIFALDLHRAECELLTGALSDAENHLAAVSARAVSMADRAAVGRLGIDLYSTLNQSGRAVGVGLDFLRYLGINWSPHPTDEEARRTYQRVWSELGRRTTEELIALPLMTDPASLATLDVLNRLSSPAQYTDRNLYTLVACQMLSLTLERGNSDASAVAYGRLGMIAGLGFGEYERAYRVGQLAYELVERRGLRRFQAGAYLNVGNMVMPWTRHIRTCCELIGHAFEAAHRSGDLVYAGICAGLRIVNLCSIGDALGDIQREAESALAVARRLQFGPTLEHISVALAIVRMLRGATATFGSLDDGPFNEQCVEREFASTSDVTAAQCWYWICKLRARFTSGDYPTALDAASRAQRLLSVSLTIMEVADYHFYSALSHAVFCDSVPAAQRTSNLDALAAHHQQLATWATACPANFENRAALVGAEMARIEGRVLEAEQLYEQAIRSAHRNGFVHIQAIAYELAARFYAARGFQKFADAYLREARYCYQRWGAEGKVAQLDHLYPDLKEESSVSTPTSTISAPTELLDLATVVKVSQAVSGEMVLEKLIDGLMRAAIEHAGAERGLLIVPRDDQLLIEAEATAGGNDVTVRQRDAAVSAAVLPESIVHYVVRAQESVILDDASAEKRFPADAYLRQHHARSVLCMPLSNRAKLIGVLYLENNLTPHVFTQARITVLRLLASQAAISLENARLYRDAQQMEAYLAAAQTLSHTGSFGWRPATGEIIWSEETYQIMGCDRGTKPTLGLVFRRIHPEDTAVVQEAIDRATLNGTDLDFEHRLLLPDGAIKSVYILAHAVQDESRNMEYVGAIMDITARKQAEEALRKTQADLAHATRVAILGEMSASIAHEINQPLGAIVNSASACLRWLTAQKLEEARQSAARVVADGHRAAEIIARIRALAKKAPPQKDWIDIDDTIREVIALARTEMQRIGIALETRLSEDVHHVPLILADRIQLQQVILNLINNALEAMSGVDDGPRELFIRSGTDETQSVLVTVRDSGHGLDPTLLDRLFDPFYTTKPQGMGMGLAISRSIIEAHGGRLWATANDDRGSTFQFTLPIGGDDMR